MRLLPILALAGLPLGLAANAQTPPDAPPALTALLDYHGTACGIQGGTLTTPAEAISTANLNGDGQTDYILDSSKLVCSTSPAMFCATDTGCELSLFVGNGQHTLIVKDWSLRDAGPVQHLVATIDGDLLNSPVDITSHMVWDDATAGLKLVPAEN
ncbi:MAG: hypothetical protein EAZ40_00930 [Rhodobacterales bacterium]|nr:MAG: hypothetical protein EAZ40_00930 [Rhodobacterales bacterium]